VKKPTWAQRADWH